MENIPHSQAALFKQVKIALLHASFYWNQVAFVHQEIPDFRKWGGKMKTIVFGCVKYLGHFICSDLSNDTDILIQRRCLSIQGNVLLRKFHICSIGVRLALFRSLCSPTYTSQPWWNY